MENRHSDEYRIMDLRHKDKVPYKILVILIFLDLIGLRVHAGLMSFIILSSSVSVSLPIFPFVFSFRKQLELEEICNISQEFLDLSFFKSLYCRHRCGEQCRVPLSALLLSLISNSGSPSQLHLTAVVPSLYDLVMISTF